MVGNLPGQPVNPDPRRKRAGAVHFLVAVVPVKQDVSPVQHGKIAARLLLFVRHRLEVSDGEVEIASLAVLQVALRSGAVD